MQVAVFSEVKWRYMRTRKRFLLSRFPPDWPIIFFEPMNRTDPNPLMPVRDGRVIVVALPVLKPKTTFRIVNRLLGLAWVRAVLTAVVRVWVTLLLVRLGWFAAGRGPRLIYLSNVLFTPVAERLPRDLWLYDANDDPLGFPGSPTWVGAYLDRTLKVADLVVSCSEALAVRLRGRGGVAVAVVGNGAEVEHFAGAPDSTRLPAAMRQLKAPKIGYVGAIAEWFDFELVGEVALAHPHASVVIVGPVAAGVRGDVQALIRAHPNVIFPGRVKYEDLPHVVGSLDVCLIPFRLGPATDVLNPNKVYEYLAAGRTVVSLAYSPDLERLREWILLAGDRREFVTRVSQALAAPFPPAALRAVAAGHSWDRRARDLLALVRERMGAGCGAGG